MKVVLFCGGLGMRMRDQDPGVPKPMVTVGSRPLMWHVMRYYAHFGHRDFILCLGHGAQSIKDFFLRYRETSSNDFVYSDAGEQIELLSSDISDWRITFVDTGIKSSIGERLRRVRAHLAGEDIFLANYADVLTDAPLPDMIDRLAGSDAIASMIAVRPQAAFHCVEVSADRRVSDIRSVHTLPLWQNGGYFVLRSDIFDWIPPGGDLVEDACAGLAQAGRMLAYPYTGFWQAADTHKERAVLEDRFASGDRPWMLWERREAAALEVARSPESAPKRRAPMSARQRPLTSTQVRSSRDPAAAG